jgi:hypothetical protein
MPSIFDTREGQRLALNGRRIGHWNRWGPYLSERAWGTVREDYSADGSAWQYFPHDHARSRTYRWNEDGLAGICDRHQYMCFALALWNRCDPILKERMFGLSDQEGNHGEDVNEYYYYLDGTPTHSYMKCLYKYPQAAFPYEKLIETNATRTKFEMEYELVDTGVFDGGRYFDVVIEYAKAAAEDILIRIALFNRGPEPAEICVLPTLWLRNTWSWGRDERRPCVSVLEEVGASAEPLRSLVSEHWYMGRYVLHCSQADDLLFTENETNTQRLYGTPSRTPYVKDAFHRYLVQGEGEAVNPASFGTKAAALYRRSVPPGAKVELKLRLRALAGGESAAEPFADFETVFSRRIAEADEFYGVVIPRELTDDAKNVVRQAFAGQLWSKQFYHYNVEEWLQGDPALPPPPPQRLTGRNARWSHLSCRDVIAMPDTWEFPWFATWDLAFHCINLAKVDPQFAKDQIVLMLREWYMDENGQLPAYEWDFSDLNPPVLALAALKIFRAERTHGGSADYEFLEQVFHKMLIVFTWWANRTDALGNDIFQGGFLGLDNVGAFDRGRLHAGYLLEQADGTAWMTVFCKSLFAMALILAERNPAYEGVASKFWEPMIRECEHHGLLHVVRPEQLRRILAYMFDENEFLSSFGVRSLSRHHRDRPYIVSLAGQEYRLDYECGESTTELFGGNSNWRGPIWIPLNFLILEALDHDYRFFGDDFRIECPTVSGRTATMREAAIELARRLSSIFLRDDDGRRPVNGPYELFDRDPHWRDLIPFYEYFDGESGRGCGASHQTGWTGLIATILIQFGPQFLSR